jgi:hypothetical protein
MGQKDQLQASIARAKADLKKYTADKFMQVLGSFQLFNIMELHRVARRHFGPKT